MELHLNKPQSPWFKINTECQERWGSKKLLGERIPGLEGYHWEGSVLQACQSNKKRKGSALNKERSLPFKLCVLHGSAHPILLFFSCLCQCLQGLFFLMLIMINRHILSARRWNYCYSPHSLENACLKLFPFFPSPSWWSILIGSWEFIQNKRH